MNNFITYNYDKVIPSNLSSKTIIMIGRGSDHLKRFDLGIKAMKYIVKEIPDCNMMIISSLMKGDNYVVNLVKELNLTNRIKFVGYTSKPEIYYQNASLHIFPSLMECFPMILSETKVYGIPNIIAGINYVSASKGGVINIIDDKPESIAKEAIKIINNEKYRKKLGKEARKSMEYFRNELTFRKWIELILSVYRGEYYYNKLRKEGNELSEKEAVNQLKEQLNLLQKRTGKIRNITVDDIQNINFFNKI